MMSKLRFFAVTGAMCPDLDAQERGLKKFVGYRADSTIGVEFKDPETGEVRKSGGFVPLETPYEVEYRAEYVRELLAGCLACADEATAKACGVTWVNPSENHQEHSDHNGQP